ncbi:MAG: hypothetical protein HQM16_00405 [Deltaproteobacteria bacterium]|nr:hypothetical protein [Deltaproteobacteria bacterium]
MPIVIISFMRYLAAMTDHIKYRGLSHELSISVSDVPPGTLDADESLTYQSDLQTPSSETVGPGKKIERIRSDFSATDSIQVKKFDVLLFAETGTTNHDLETVPLSFLNRLNDEGLVKMRAAQEIQWEVSEISALKGFIQSVQDQIFPIRRQTVEITKKLLHHTREIEKIEDQITSWHVNSSWMVMTRSFMSYFNPEIDAGKKKERLEQKRADHVHAAHQLVEILRDKKNQIEAMESDMAVFEAQLNRFRSSIEGYFCMGRVYIKLTASGKKVLERMKRFHTAEFDKMREVPLFHN